MKLVNINNSAPFGYAGLISGGGGAGGKTARGAGRRVKLKPGTGLQTIFRCVRGAWFFFRVLCGCSALLKWIGRAIASVRTRVAIATKNARRARAAGVVAAIVMASSVLAACQTEASEPVYDTAAELQKAQEWINDANPTTGRKRQTTPDGVIGLGTKDPITQSNRDDLLQAAIGYFNLHPSAKFNPEVMNELKRQAANDQILKDNNGNPHSFLISKAPVNKKQYVATANRNAKSVVAASHA